jgi:molybdate transport system regulatory protein
MVERPQNRIMEALFLQDIAMPDSAPLKVDDQLSVVRADERFLASARVRLLEAIEATGSISKAARQLGIGYKSAWVTVDAINNLADEPIVERTAGGRRGGGTRLTAHGRELIRRFRALEERYQHAIDHLQRGLAASGSDDRDGTDAAADHAILDRDLAVARRLAMKVSARNLLHGTVTTITDGAVNCEVVLDIGSGDRMVASITRASAEALGLRVGCDACALIKASFVMLAANGGARLSARNQLTGTVVRCLPGAVNAEVTLELTAGRTLTAIVTNESLEELGLEPGVRATALIKASHVILAVVD